MSAVKKILANVALASLLLAALFFVADDVVLRIRGITKHNALGSVTVQYYYAIPHKNGKTEFVFQPPHARTCVHSALPHMGYSPCWYLAKHPEQPIKI